MRKGQTSIRDGIQDFLCPVSTLYITQGENEGSHKGTKAIDSTNAVVGQKAPYFAPADLKVARIIHDSATVIWHTVKPVRLANGKVSHVTVVTAHDNTINFNVGYVIKQGLQMGNMGDKGIGSGVHVHLEQGYGHQTTLPKNGYTFTLNGYTYPIYGLKDQISFEDAYFMDGTEIKRGVAKWVYLKDVEVSSGVKQSGTWKWTDLDIPVKVRNGENGLNGSETGFIYKNNMSVNYDKTYTKDGYIWISYISNTGVRRSVAVGQGNKLWGKNI